MIPTDEAFVLQAQCCHSLKFPFSFLPTPRNPQTDEKQWFCGYAGAMHWLTGQKADTEESARGLVILTFPWSMQISVFYPAASFHKIRSSLIVFKNS